MILVVLGVLGGLYFWLTDPRFGPAGHRRPEGSLDVRYWLHVARGSPDNVVDAANTAWLVTLVGMAGSLAVLAIGGWLLTRRPV
jgi:hypothetical protein